MMIAMAEQGGTRGSTRGIDRTGGSERMQHGSPHTRLESWKQIADYLGRDVRTVQRWERSSGLPVYRLMHEKTPTVYALVDELDAWLSKRTAGPQNTREPEQVQHPIPAPAPKARIWLAGAIVAVLAGAGFWLAVRREKPGPQLRMPIPLTSDPGWEWGPQLSPDGRSVAYTRADANTGPQVVVQLLGGGQLLEIAGSNRDTYAPSWSSDGNSIALLRRQSSDLETTQLIILPAFGGPEQKLADVVCPGAFQGFRPEPYIDWSPDGRFLVVCDRTGVDRFGLVMISVDSGEKKSLTDGGGQIFGDYSPRFSPDGRQIAFSRVVAYGISQIKVLELTSDMRPAGPPRDLPSDGLWNAAPAWTSDGQQLVFLSGTLRNPRLSIADADGKRPPTTLPVVDYGIGPFDLGKNVDGYSRLVYTRFHQDEDIWKIPLKKIGRAENSHSIVEAVKVIDSSYSDVHPRFSPDGSRFVFVSNRTGNDELWTANADGSRPQQLTKLKAGRIGRPAWSPDGKRIAFELLSEDAPGIYEIDAGGGQARKIVAGGAGESHPEWSPDGQWLYFSSKRSGESCIWKMKIGGGPRSRSWI